MTQRRLVLVTGTPRSGTTPIGDALAAAPGVRTVYEPLNRHVGDRRVQRYFEVPGAGGFSPATADALIDDIAALRLRLRPGVFPDDRGARRLVKRVTGSRTRATYWMARLDRRAATLVWKDPFAVFLAERVAARGIPVIVTVRPAPAVAASFKRLGWSFDVPDLVARMGSDGPRSADLIRGVDLGRPALNGAALWCVVNDWLLRASERNDGIALLDLERFVTDRDGVLRALYERVGLPWGEHAEQHLRGTAGADGPTAPSGQRAHVARRDASAVNRYWVDVLEPQEARQVEEITGDLAARLAQAPAVLRP